MTFSKTNSKRSRRSLWKLLPEIVFTVASCVSVLGLWTVAASVYLSPAKFSYVGVVGLGFPLVLGGTIVVFILCLLFCPRRSWITFLGLLCVSGSIRSYYPLNFLGNDAEAADESLCVMNYNCDGFANNRDDNSKKAIMQYFFDERLDIICFQEGVSSIDTWKDLDERFGKQFPHIVFPYQKETHLGICSRFPIQRTQLLTHYTGNGAVAFWLQMPRGDSLLVVNCHLKSNKLSQEIRSQYSDIVRNPQTYSQNSDYTYRISRSMSGSIISAAVIRANMADTISDFLRRHPQIPTIVCGDFNETPISYSCHTMKQLGLSDAYRAKGNGMGRSFNRDAIAVRIDHQFFSEHFDPLSAHIDQTKDWSDHYPLIVEYKIKQQ